MSFLDELAERERDSNGTSALGRARTITIDWPAHVSCTFPVADQGDTSNINWELVITGPPAAYDHNWTMLPVRVATTWEYVAKEGSRLILPQVPQWQRPRGA